VKSETALRVVTPLLEQPVADRRNWTIPRLRAEIEAREGVRISRSQLSKALRKKSSVGGDRVLDDLGEVRRFVADDVGRPSLRSDYERRGRSEENKRIKSL